MRVVLKAAYDRFSVEGSDAVDLAIALERIGIDLTLLPTSMMPGLPSEFTKLLEKNPTGPKDLLIQFGQMSRPPAEFAPMPCFVFARHEILREHPLDGWHGAMVTAPSDVELFDSYTIPFAVIPLGVMPGQWPARRRTGEKPTKFLMAAPDDEFLKIWDEVAAEPGFDATLTTSRGDATQKEQVDVYHAHDVMVSTTDRNRAPVEFMCTGGVAMAPDRGENQNWLHPDMAIPLAKMPGGKDLDAAHVKTQIRWAAQNPHVIRRMGESAAGLVAASMSWESVARRLMMHVGRMM